MRPRQIATRDRRQYLRRTIARIASEHGAAPGHQDIQRLRLEMVNDDPATRLRAARQICPCTMEWQVFLLLRRDVKALRSDPDRRVREVAYHVEEDARTIEALNALNDNLPDLDDEEEDYQLKKDREVERYRRRQLRCHRR